MRILWLRNKNHDILYNECKDPILYRDRFSMNRLTLLFIILMLASGACINSESYKDRYTLKPVDNPLEIPIGSQTRNFVYYSQYVLLDGINYLGILNYERNRIEIYNLDSGTLTRIIQFFHEGPEAFGRVSNFFIETLDSLLVDCDSEMSVGIADGRGKILKEISYREDINGRRFIPTPPWIGSRPYKIGNIIYYLQSHMYEESNGILSEEKRKETFLNVALNTETGICFTPLLIYPDEMVGREVWRSPNVMRTINGNGLFVYHFANLADLFVSNDLKSLRKVPIESNYRLKLNEESFKYRYDMTGALMNTVTHDMIRDIFYDKYHDCYYLFYMKRNENPDAGINLFLKLQYPDCFILILDKNLHHMGEVFLPDNTYSFQFSFITPEGLYISEDHPNNPEFDEDYMRFRLFKLVKL